MAVLFLFVAAACGNNNKNLGLNDNDNNGNKKNDGLGLSSLNTTMNSGDYPHTEPVLMRPAQYEFRIINGNPGGQFAFDGRNFYGATPNYPQATYRGQQQQTQTQQAPQQRAQTGQAPQQQTQKAAPTAGISAVETQVIQLTNAQRRKNGLPDLQADPSLSKVAREKANDMQTKHYFSHTSPTYGSPFDMMRDFGISYRAAGENIAQGQRTAEEVVNAWMNSEGHRRNILSPDYTHIGVGYSQTGNYWSQMFIKK